MSHIEILRRLVARAAKGTEWVSTMEFGEKVALAAYRLGFKRGRLDAAKRSRARETQERK